MPDNVIVDCGTGDVVCIPLTDEEIAARKAIADELAAQQQAAEAARVQLVTAVQASTDSTVLALAQLVGILPSQAEPTNNATVN